MSAMTTATITRNDFAIEPFPAYAYASEPTSSTATPSDTGHRQRWSSPSEVSSLHSFHSSHPEHDRPVSPASCHSGSPPSYTPPVTRARTSAAEAALGHVAERPVAIPQQRPTPTAPFYPAYAPSLRNHGITPAAWRKFVANMNEAILTTSSVSDHTRSITRRIRAASGGMWSAIVSSSASLVPGSKDNSKNADSIHHTNDESSGSGSGSGSGTGASSSTGRTSPPTPTSPPTTSGPCRTLREERVIACVAAANIAWFHPQGLHVAMVDTTVLAGKLVGAGSGDVRGILPSRLVEAARPRRDEGPAAQLAALRPWIAELEVDRPESGSGGSGGSAYAAKTVLDLAPYSLWIVVTRRTEGDIAAGY
ncbi:uncharacterized protein PG986_000068 [Apiospora aurea]|uniref:Uncharacterized protein n=1 Tax=Apiospora aurea TaxID=335848 RepID=A0ABR1QTW8_9PEZI